MSFPVCRLATVIFFASSFWSAANAACTPIATINQLQAMRDDLAGDYCLTNDIDAASRPNFAPVGNPLLGHGVFTGRLDGRGHAIRNLTITSGIPYVGLFAVTDNAVITNLRLLNIKVTSTAMNAGAGGLASISDGNNGSSTISNVHVSGTVKCTGGGGGCAAGGLIASASGTGLVNLSSSAATVTASTLAGGLIARTSGTPQIARSYATGSVGCTAATNCILGGLIGRASGGSVLFSFATGPVKGSNGSDSRTGGLIGLTESGTTISRSFAASQVDAGSAGFAAGLIGQHNSGGSINQAYSVGPVSGTGATVTGFIANAGGSPSITSSYWDTDTSGQAAGTSGTGLTTAQLHANLPVGFGGSWAITTMRSYPFFSVAAIDFSSPLATVVAFSRPYVFVPIGQLEDGEYKTAPAHADEASLAAVYTMIARSVGISDGDNRLVNTKIDRFFWDDATQTTFWRGPVKLYAQLGSMTAIAAATPLNNANVVGSMNTGKLVILRGVYRKGGATETHWMLGTLYTKDSGNNVDAIIANDPFTGKQVRIDSATKTVQSPANFPLKNFRVNGYRPVTFTLPASDRRLKRDIVKVANLDNGLSLYRYRYNGSRQRYVGVMAQEVAAIRPDAVVTGPDGYMRVDYRRLGTHLQTWREWRAHRNDG
jgi:hypothetical protein